MQIAPENCVTGIIFITNKILSLKMGLDKKPQRKKYHISEMILEFSLKFFHKMFREKF